MNIVKTLKIISLSIILYLVVFVCDIFYFPISYNKLDFPQRTIVNSINTSWDGKVKSVPAEEQGLVSQDELMKSLNFLERRFVDRVFAIDPKVLGFKGDFFSKEIPSDLVKVLDKEIKLGDVDVGINYLPQAVFDDYSSMNEKMEKDINKELFVESGYRSPGYQAYLFFYYLPENNYSLMENSKWLTMPGYSEHNSQNTAIDFISADGIDGDAGEQTIDDFMRLEEYKWLENNAMEYNFYLSYPENNPYGISFEPWHWHWEKKIDIINDNK
ncbi:MAG: D-alanyl-D-alanine carboxypeptidase family protein [Candidatus Pacebacteria bacterium]|nr:D-alanyl-D-alanine carboxypeptidase family protein [Candidatus Paceibacterota bacterium]